MKKLRLNYQLLYTVLIFSSPILLFGSTKSSQINAQEEMQLKKQGSFEQSIDSVAQKKADFAKSIEEVEKALSYVPTIIQYGLVAKVMYDFYTGGTKLFNATLKAIEGEGKGKGEQVAGAGSMDIYLPGDITMKFSDVAGLSHAKKAMKDMINSQTYKTMGAKPLKGVLMTGGPGNGKTLLAKAVAGELNLPFINTSGTDFKTQYAGGGVMQIRAVFKKARELAQKYGSCIIFIDEIDAIALKRGNDLSDANQDSVNTTNALLTEMDGLNTKISENPIIVLAATNRAELLDPAVMRPGRFDRKIEVAKPNAKDRKELLAIALKEVPKSQNVMQQIDRLVAATQDFSGADVANVVNEAIILAGNAGHEKLTQEDLDLALDNIKFGNLIEDSDLTQEEKYDLALYQAGRSIAFDILDKNNRLERISIELREKNKLGAVHVTPVQKQNKVTKDNLKNSIIIALTGSVAQVKNGNIDQENMIIDQEVYEKAYIMTVQYTKDFNEFRTIPYQQMSNQPSYSTGQVKAAMNVIITECITSAESLVEKHWKYIQEIANLILKKGTVLGEEFYDIINPRERFNAEPKSLSSYNKEALKY